MGNFIVKLIFMKTQYENGIVSEYIILEYENDTIKINGYHVTSDEF